MHSPRAFTRLIQTFRAEQGGYQPDNRSSIQAYQRAYMSDHEKATASGTEASARVKLDRISSFGLKRCFRMVSTNVMWNE